MQLNGQSGPLGHNLFAYCGNNPVNNKDPDGHFYFGALIGGIVGGLTGALIAKTKGKSVISGLVTGAISGAAIGLVCDVAATGGLSMMIGAVLLCGAIAGVANAVNQYVNYRVEKKEQTRSKNPIINSQTNTYNNKTPTSSNGKLASECADFGEYVDYTSIAISSATAMVFAPLSISASNMVNKAFEGVNISGVSEFIAKFAANFVTGGNISMVQSTIDLM